MWLQEPDTVTVSPELKQVLPGKNEDALDTLWIEFRTDSLVHKI